MLNATDSFIEYIASEIDPYPVYWARQSEQDEHADYLKPDALNVQFMGFYESGSIEYCLTSLDLLGSDERTVLTKLKILRDALFNVQLTLEYDYTDPSAPVATGRAVSWQANRIKFLNVKTPRGARYVHYNATFPLVYTRQ